MRKSPPARWFPIFCAVVMAATMMPLALAGQTFKEAIVHGDGIEEPFRIDQEGVPMCLWFFTYNFGAHERGPPEDPNGPSITLSFLTEAETRAAVVQPIGAAIALAGFHTRLLISDERAPFTQYLKPRDETFNNQIRIRSDAEVYFAKYRIPTRLGASGAPETLQVSEEDTDLALATLAADFGYALPNSRSPED